ncbi:MAG: hypothetical protein H7A46_08055 [Verrucomicrobiales bacterium]|nr:hypothetical protein [Verrucomicrobiales bacterium]
MESTPDKLFSKTRHLPRGLPTPFMVVAGLVAFGSLLVEHGCRLPSGWVLLLHALDLLAGAGYIADRVALFRRNRDWRAVLRGRFSELAVLVALAGVAGGLMIWPETTGSLVHFLHESTSQALFMDVVQLFLLGNLLIHLLRLQQYILARGLRPEMILIGSFAMIVLAGTLLLLLPRASGRPARPIGVMDALFTSTSACCVTGLAVRDTGTDFSVLGQGMILALCQVGGLGIMAFVAFLAVTSTRSLPVEHLLAFKHLVSARSLAGLRRQVLLIVVGTLFIEGVGAACLFAFLPSEGDALVRLRWSVFHAVSAFCNAGFGLASDSLVAWQSDGRVLTVVMALIILGGFGFLVIADLFSVRLTRWPLLRRIPWCCRHNEVTAVRRLPVQTRLSLIVTGLLLGVGFVGFWVLEHGHVLRGQPWAAQGWIAAFQSVTPRTAGFNTVPIGDLQPATLILLMALMVVGACPVSTGGGVKTVTLGVLVLTLRALARGRRRVEVFGRALPQTVVYAALSVFILYIAAAALGIFGLACCDPELPLRDLAFELISALSTVGLSTGITPGLSTGSKLILCAAMFIGRVGPLSLVMSVIQAAPRALYEFPEEELLVG